ncbi:hypothetical protein V1279_007465 [Bradyrhizobium sp. AZCC 1610]
MVDDLNQAYADAVKAVVGSVVNVYDSEWGARSWERLLVDYESLLHERDPVTSTIAFALARYPQAPLEKVAFDLSPEAEACLQRIGEIMHGRDGKWWTTCRLTVEPDGRYDFQFDYGPPYRLSGNLNDRRYVDYLHRYKVEKGGR